MDLKPVAFRSPLTAYEQQAQALLAGHRAADPAVIDLFHHRHPRFLDESIKWRPKFIPTRRSETPLWAKDYAIRLGVTVTELSWS